ncbi:ATP-binding protein [Prauserella cavernicola]|uniref:ATP-binding protein n=1 Tax=Prauserella cavernicola TaxID=2800127 RepID=A0A934V3B6_9PSEU|nr:ATP-binding protein [Prauserella cavernicola]MBK1782815.1 ATP-binding protein [Prauserella cavernicola]
MNSQTAQVDDLRLVALPSALNCTDLFVRFSLTEWSLPALREEVTRAARSLVQAVIDKTNPRAPGFMTLRLRIAGDCLVIELEDDQLARMHERAPTVDGRQTGAVPIDGRGKLVWCEIPLPGGISAAGVRLPRRDERRSQLADADLPEPAQGGVDPALVDRVLVGLKRDDW